MATPKTLRVVGQIVLLAAVIRLIGVDWDQRQHLHPNERFLTTVETGIQWPSANGLATDFNEAESMLNPRTVGYSFLLESATTNFTQQPVSTARVLSQTFVVRSERCCA